MQIVFDDGTAQRELDVQVNNPAATVADLVAALVPGRDADVDGVLVGGRLAHADLGIGECGLYEGAVVRLPDDGRASKDTQFPATTGRSTDGTLVLDVIGGLDAGRRFPLPPGDHLLGRDPTEADVVLPAETVSHRHAVLTVTQAGAVEVRDLGSHNGTWLGDEAVPASAPAPTPMPEGALARLGALQVVTRRARTDDRPLAVDPLRHTTPAGTLPFNRPPRPAPAPEPEPFAVPAPPQAPSGWSPFSLVSVLAPLIFGVSAAVLFKNPMFLLFALLSPVMAVGTWIEGRRRGKKTSRHEEQRYATELAQLETDLAQGAVGEVERWTAALPDLAEVLRRATLPSVTLWERRAGHDDFLRLRAGIGTVPWKPPLRGMHERTAALSAALERASVLPDAPVPVELANGGVVGIVGERAAALALARALVCQAAVHHGPADLTVAVCVRPDAATEWDWTKWLPHVRDAGGGNRLLTAGRELATAMLQSILTSRRPDDRNRPARVLGAPGEQVTGPTLLLVVDDESLTEGRRAPARTLLRGGAGPVAGIVLASTADRLPAVCTTVIELRGPDGEASLERPQEGIRFPTFLATGVADDIARVCARALARFDDPELEVPGAGLPDRARLLPLLGIDQVDADAVARRWKQGGPDPSPTAPIGVTEDDVFSLDIVRDGPHGLVAGTTGAGKSELLRTFVAGLAASVDPDHLTFLLVDFKGGSAFDECARLPHTVGLVTDLDEHLAERALRCLEAELRFRERLLRQAGATDLPEYLRSGRGTEPLPRLLVVIDEFATLKAELPDFVDALVGVAQRGRSLGVHLVLATQRPTGAVSENIRANTNLRIALRVQDGNDSSDVIGTTDAASLPRSRPGRAYVRLGPGEIIAIQTALSTASADRGSLAAIDVAPFRFGPAPRVVRAGAPAGDGDAGPAAPTGPTDLTLLVNAIDSAFERSARPRPRRPWPEPLAPDIDLAALAATPMRDPADTGLVAFAVADDPEAQSQYPAGWRPPEGNLLLYGIVGSGTTTALASIALTLARTSSPDDLHLYALDFGAGELTALGDLPHAGAVIGATERERQQRLVRFLRAELDRRRQRGANVGGRHGEPRIVVLLDGYGAFKAEFDDLAGMAVADEFTRVIADGPEVGIYTVLAADRSGAVPSAIASTIRQKILFRLADPFEYGSFGVQAKSVPAMVPGRAVLAETSQVIHVARPAVGLTEAVAAVGAAAPRASRPPEPIGVLPSAVPISRVVEAAQLVESPWLIPVGLGERTLGPASLVVFEGEHVLIAGPARCGKSTALATIGSVVARARPDVRLVAVAGGRSPMRTNGLAQTVLGPEDLSAMATLAGAATRAEPVLVLIDDADAIEDGDGVLTGLMASPHPGLHVVAAGRNDAFRALYSHWTRSVRRSKLGVLLRPDVDLDGDLLGVTLPRRAPVAMVAGRGYLVNSGDLELVQIASA